MRDKSKLRNGWHWWYQGQCLLMRGHTEICSVWMVDPRKRRAGWYWFSEGTDLPAQMRWHRLLRDCKQAAEAAADNTAC